jgi:hypothetical protein
MIPRWVLVVKYFCFILVGLTVFAASSPSLDLTTIAGYTPIWGLAVILTGAGALIGSARPRLEPLERWSVLFLSALLLGYAAAPIQLVFGGDVDRAAYSVLALTLSLLPSARAWMLIRRTGQKHG